jgi:hypothetical protein
VRGATHTGVHQQSLLPHHHDDRGHVEHSTGESQQAADTHWRWCYLLRQRPCSI